MECKKEVKAESGQAKQNDLFFYKMSSENPHGVTVEIRDVEAENLPPDDAGIS